MDTNNIDVVRAIVKAARPSDAKRAPRRPQKPPPRSSAPRPWSRASTRAKAR